MKIKFWEENYCFKEYNIYQNSIYSKILIFSKVGGFQWGLTVPPPQKKKKNPDAQIKFLYYPRLRWLTALSKYTSDNQRHEIIDYRKVAMLLKASVLFFESCCLMGKLRTFPCFAGVNFPGSLMKVDILKLNMHSEQ